MIRSHFVDSLSCACSAALKPNARLLDIGTGAGFPGLPLKIYRPDLHVTAVDAVSKKIAFLRHLCRMLALQQIECVAARVENLAALSGVTAHAAPLFDVIVSRATGALPYLLTLAAPLLKNDGCLLLQRGPQALQELSDHAEDLSTAGFRVTRSQEIRFSWLEYPRYIVELYPALTG